MAQAIRFNYTEMDRVAKSIDDIKQAYFNAGQKMISEFENAVSAWEGDSKEKLLTLMKTAINDYVTKSIPDAVGALATLLRENAKAMQQADNQIASQIPNNI